MIARLGCLLLIWTGLIYGQMMVPDLGISRQWTSFSSVQNTQKWILSYNLEDRWSGGRYQFSFDGVLKTPHDSLRFRSRGQWVELNFDPWVVRVGLDSLNYSIMDAFQPFNSINPIEMGMLIDSVECYVPMVRMSKPWLLGEIEGVWLPLQPQLYWESPRDPFYVFKGTSIESLQLGQSLFYDTDFFDSSRRYPAHFWGIKVSQYWRSMDFQWMGLHTMDWVNPLFGVSQNRLIHPVYLPMFQLGFSVTAPVRNWDGLLIKSELVYRDLPNNDIVWDPSRLPLIGVDDYGLWVIGGELTVSFWQSHSILCIGEFQTAWSTSQSRRQQLPFQSDVFLGGQWSRDGFRSWDLSLGVIQDQDDSSDRIMILSLDYRWNDSVHYGLTGRWFQMTGSNSEFNGLRRFDQLDHWEVSVKWVL